MVVSHADATFNEVTVSIQSVSRPPGTARTSRPGAPDHSPENQGYDVTTSVMIGSDRLLSPAHHQGTGRRPWLVLTDYHDGYELSSSVLPL